MKKIFFVLFFPLAAFCQVKIVDLPASTNLTGTEVLPLSQSGVTRKVTVNQLGEAQKRWRNMVIYTASGTNTYTATVTGYTAYTAGDELKILFTNANSGASTLNVNSLGAIGLRKNGSTPLSSGDIAAGTTYILSYDGTNFQVLNIPGAGGGGGTVASLAEAQAGTDNTKIMSPLRVKQVNETVYNIEAYGAVADGNSNSSGAINIGSNILNAAGFFPSDVGKTIEIPGAGVAGATLFANITAYNSSTQVVISVNASTTVTGKKVDWGTDNTTAINNALIDCYNAGGGVVFTPVRPLTFMVFGQINIPNNGLLGSSSLYANRSIKIKGGVAFAAPVNDYTNGSIWDMRYVGSGGSNAKILTTGVGLLEIQDMVFVNYGSVYTTPFLKTTNTVLWVHHNAFMSVELGVNCRQDCIVLGGTLMPPSTDPNSGFTGYGTIIEHNFFQKIQTGIIGQTYCNAVVIRANIFWTACGGNQAIYWKGDVTNSSGGNIIQDNLFEMIYYKYAIYLDDYTTSFSIINNGFYDYDGGTGQNIAQIYMAATSIGHNIVDPLSDQNITNFISAPHKNYNVRSTNGRKSNYVGPTDFTGNFIKLDGTGLKLQRPTTNEKWYFDNNATQDRLSLFIDRTAAPLSGAIEGFFELRRELSNQQSMNFNTGLAIFQNEQVGGQLRVYSGSNGFLRLGSGDYPTDKYIYQGVFYDDNDLGYKFRSTGGLGWTGGATAFAATDSRLERQSARRLRITDGGSAVGSLSSTFINPAQFSSDANADAGFVGASAPDGTIYSNSTTGAPRAKISGSWIDLASRSIINSQVVATDANITAAAGVSYFVPASTFTVNRTIDVSTLNTDNDYIEIFVDNQSFTLSFTGASVYLADNVTTVSTLLLNAHYQIRRKNGRLYIIN